MAVLKKIGIILGVLLILFLVLGLVMPKNITVTTSREIDVPANYLYNLAQDVRAAGTWNPFVGEDTTMQVTYGPKMAGEGASYSWVSSKMGNGSAVYTKLVPNESIEADLMFEGMDKSKYSFGFKPDGKSTDVSWTMETSIGFPMNVFSPFFKYSIKKYYKNGLKALEALAENRYKNKVYDGYQIMEQQQDERKYIMSRGVVGFQDIQKYYTQNLGALFQKVQSEGLTMKGLTCALYFKYDDASQTTDMAAAIPVNTEKTIKDVSSITIPAKPAVVVDYTGDYDKVGSAHSAISAYLKDHGLLMDAPVIEEFITDPLQEKDPSKWQTKVIYYYSKSNM